MRDMSYFTNVEPIDYSKQDELKHLRYRDYKHLKDVDWDDNEPVSDKIITYVSILAAFLLILFIA